MKDIVIKKFKPLYTEIITTMDVYEEDVVIDGRIVAPKGAMKMYQKVIAAGETARCVHEGDFVLLDLRNYVKQKFREDSLKEGMEKLEDVKVFDFPKIFLNGVWYAKLQERDVEGIIEDHEFIEVETASNEDNNLL